MKDANPNNCNTCDYVIPPSGIGYCYMWHFEPECVCFKHSLRSKLLRTVPQAVFDSPEANKAAKQGHKEACDELNRTPRHLLDEGNPNHPMYDLHIFGEHHESFLARQYLKGTN